MVKIDLITGFLGSGKTTFIRQYAKYLISQGEKIVILENDYGAVNVDALLLQDLEGDACEIETIAGGCDHDCHIRRFKTKLIAMGMLGYDRVIVEPSGIYDVDEFFDVLHEEPLDRWYEIGNVITILDVRMLRTEGEVSGETGYFLVSQTSCAGLLVLSHTGDGSPVNITELTARLNELMEGYRCGRRVDGSDILVKDWKTLTEDDFKRISSSGYRLADHIKLPLEDDNAFRSLYFLDLPSPLAELEDKTALLFRNQTLGTILRVKGFHLEHGQWYELNASRSKTAIEKCDTGQELFIVIGENLDPEAIRRLLCIPDDVWHNGNVYAGTTGAFSNV